jgi:hypothetical protein
MKTIDSSEKHSASASRALGETDRDGHCDPDSDTEWVRNGQTDVALPMN